LWHRWQSGSGKSTLLNLLWALTSNIGTVEVAGTAIQVWTRAVWLSGAAAMWVCVQVFSIAAHIDGSGERHAAHGFLPALSRSERRKRHSISWTASVWRRKQTNCLARSPGEQQRAAIARALPTIRR